MKKLVTLLLAAGMVFSLANSASAVELKPSGYWDFTFERYQNVGYGDGTFLPFQDTDDVWHNFGENLNQKHGGAVQRLRLNFDFVVSENLSATWQAQVGTFTWGGPANPAGENSGGAFGTRSSNITTRYAYLDWMVPTTRIHVRMGQQPMALPSFTFGSPILDDSATGILVSGPINDNITLSGFWSRLLSSNRRGTAASMTAETDDLFDLFGVVADFAYDGFRISPWATFGTLGYDATTTTINLGGVPTAVPTGYSGVLPVNFYLNPNTGVYQPSNGWLWMAGVSAELTMFDPFRFTADAYVSQSKNDHDFSERGGWYVAAGAEYKTAYGTPALKGWYASGDDDNMNDGSERPLTLSGAFNPTTTYFDGVYSIGNNIDVLSADGTWGLSLQWNGLSFIRDLSHDFAVTYFQGTNHKNNVGLMPFAYMTTADAAWEFDFNTTYNIYQNLATVLELSYILEDFGKGNINRVTGVDPQFSDVWRASLNFRYSF